MVRWGGGYGAGEVSEGRIITVKATPRKMSQQEERPREEESLEGPRLALSPYSRFPNKTLQTQALFRSSKRLGKNFLGGKPDTCGHCPSPYRNWQMLRQGGRKGGKVRKRRRGGGEKRKRECKNLSLPASGEQLGREVLIAMENFALKAQVFKWCRLFSPILLENFKE